jgi:UDP-2,3-diacylglucosamine hydrolase
LILSLWFAPNKAPPALTEPQIVSLAGADRALFASDMHLGEHDPATAEFFLKALDDALEGKLQAPERALENGRFSHVFLLGDLFETWVGDDDRSHPYSSLLASLITGAQMRGAQVFIMQGNRDFLLGKAPPGEPTWLAGGKVTFLPDPYVIDAFGARTVLTHGDQLCTDDVDYQKYRTIVRAENWLAEFLATSLRERKALAQSIRLQSTSDKRAKPMAWMDANDTAILNMAKEAGASVMIHGHTHRPARHQHGSGAAKLTRYVMPDWSVGRSTTEGATAWGSESQRGYFLVADAAGIRALHPIQPS